MTKNCGRHDKPIPMFPAVIDFHLQKLFIGYYCIYCHNFIPKNNPEIDVYKKMLAETEKVKGII
ncbi:MAG: hypothetical protein V3T40_01955 [Nitrososphaerales archaeon]